MHQAVELSELSVEELLEEKVDCFIRSLHLVPEDQRDAAIEACAEQCAKRHIQEHPWMDGGCLADELASNLKARHEYPIEYH